MAGVCGCLPRTDCEFIQEARRQPDRAGRRTHPKDASVISLSPVRTGAVVMPIMHVLWCMLPKRVNLILALNYVRIIIFVSERKELVARIKEFEAHNNGGSQADGS
jgi:hypothetical protein